MVYEAMVQILDFDLFKYSEAIKTISEEDINRLPSCPILQKSEKIRDNILTMFDSHEYYCSCKQDLLIVDTKSFFLHKVQSLNTK